MSRIARWAPFALVLIVVAGIAARQQRAPTFGFVNLQAVMEQTPGFADARDTWQSEVQQYESEIQRLQDTLTAKIQDFDQQSVVLSATARTERQNELTQLQQQLQERAQELQIRSQERQRELLSPLESRVQAVIDGLRAERNLGAVFDIGAQGSSIISADPALNLTAEVVRRLQQQGQ